MTVRVGFIGVGGMAEGHIGKMGKIEGAELTAVYDINQARSQEIADKYGARSYSAMDQMLDSGQVDAVFICTPPFARGDIEVEVAKRGIHLLSEKPVGLKMDEVLRKEQIIRESGVIHASGYCLRYLDIAEQAREYLADKQIELVLAYRLGGMPGVRWWRMLEQSGGQLVEQSTHQVDQIRNVAGDITHVHALHIDRAMKQFDPEATAYDAGTVSFIMANGAIGNITSTCLAKYAGGRGDIEFFGSNFYVSLGMSSLRIKDDTRDVTIKSEVDFTLEQDRAFIEAVRTGDRSGIRCDYSEAVKTLAVTLAANESAEQGGTQLSVDSLLNR